MDFLATQLSIRPLSVAQSSKTQGSQVSQQVSDEELLERISLNDADALGCLFRRYARLVHGIGCRILRDKTEAEDFVQDFFLYLHRKCSVFKSEKGRASSWIVQTIYYQALQRRMRLAGGYHNSSMPLESTQQNPTVPLVAMEYDRSLEGMIGRARFREIQDCLTADQLETLRLHFFEGYTLSEIATKRKQSLGNVRHHFYRGLEKLRSHVFRGELQDRITSGTR